MLLRAKFSRNMFSVMADSSEQCTIVGCYTGTWWLWWFYDRRRYFSLVRHIALKVRFLGGMGALRWLTDFKRSGCYLNLVHTCEASATPQVHTHVIVKQAQEQEKWKISLCLLHACEPSFTFSENGSKFTPKCVKWLRSMEKHTVWRN